jgi:chromosome segregation ATPase
MGVELETALGQVKGEAKEASNVADEHQRRSEMSVQKVTALMTEIADLEKKRAQAQETVKKAVTDAKELQTLAKHLSERTDAIETQLKAQIKKSDKAHAEMEEARSRAVTALANAMDLSKQLAAAKEQIHTHETRAIKAQAEARQHQEALAAARERISELEANERDILTEASELRAELADSWNQNGTAPQSSAETKQGALSGSDLESRARRVEEDLRFERMHVQLLERRLTSWSGIASAALRKITRLGRKPPPKRKPAKRLAGPVPARG